MSIRHAMEEAFHRGEKIKDQIFSEVMSSEAVNGLLQNELFLRSLTKVLNTKYEIERAVRTNIRTVLKALNVPSRDEINTMERKIHRLEGEIDGIHRKLLTSRLSKSKGKKTAARSRAKAASTKSKTESH
jgi:polyhydroxyalkanoate synthesis regulator phasin